MKNTIIGLFLFLSFSLFASDNLTKVEDFTLLDYNGKEYTLSSFAESKAVVLIFVSTRCPVSNAYNERMAGLYKNYSEKEVTFLGINSNKAEDVTEIKEHADENGLKFGILKDVENVIADKLSAKFTPEVFVIDRSREILYHGRIDDSRKEEDVERKDLEIALEEILAGKSVSNPETKAFGCSIKRVEK